MNKKKIKKIIVVLVAAVFGAMLLLSAYVELVLPYMRQLNRSTEVPTVLELANKNQTSIEKNSNQDDLEAELFTNRDLMQEIHDIDAEIINLENDQIYNIDNEGVYILRGNVTNTSVHVTVDSESKVQLFLDGITIINENQPAINVVSGDKVFITTSKSTNKLSVKGVAKLDSVIYSKSDLVLNGKGTIEITSSEGNGISSKDDLKITGGTYDVDVRLDGFEANDSIRISDGTFNVISGKDGFHSEDNDDASLGYIYISGGNINITAGDDGIRGNSLVQIDNGIIEITDSSEGVEGTYILINGGTVDIYAKDDGINAASKSGFAVAIVINDGDIKVEVASGNTDCLDSNGFITIAGGNLDVTGDSTFDADFEMNFTGGIVINNGIEVNELPRSH